MLCRFMSKKQKRGHVPVYLNVYDLTPINEYAYWLGLGIYHSGVQVYDMEFGFGAREDASSGIFEVEPKDYPGYSFRKSICIGRTDLPRKDVQALMKFFDEKYLGNTYNMFTKNCNHFCNDVCLKLTGEQIPRWVNRLARIGYFCKCVLPVMNETQIRPAPHEDKVSDADEIRLSNNSSKKGTLSPSSKSTRRPGLSSSSSLNSQRTSPSPSTNSRQRRGVPSPASLIRATSTPTNHKV